MTASAHPLQPRWHFHSQSTYMICHPQTRAALRQLPDWSMYYRRGRHAVESITIIIIVVVVVVVIMLLLELTSVDSENVTQYVISPPTTCAPLIPPHPGQSAPHAHTHIAPVNQAATDKYSPIFYSSWTGQPHCSVCAGRQSTWPPRAQDVRSIVLICRRKKSWTSNVILILCQVSDLVSFYVSSCTYSDIHTWNLNSGQI